MKLLDQYSWTKMASNIEAALREVISADVHTLTSSEGSFSTANKNIQLNNNFNAESGGDKASAILSTKNYFCLAWKNMIDSAIISQNSTDSSADFVV